MTFTQFTDDEDSDGGEVYAVLESGSVCYSIQEAAVDIDMLISALEEARDQDGVTKVALESGNHRGAQYQHLLATYDVH